MCDSLIKEGPLYHKKQGGRGTQKWIRRYAELYAQSAEGVSRLELYDVKEGHKKGGQKTQQTISLKSCIKITNAPCQKSQKFVIELVFEGKSHMLAADSQGDLELWIGDLRRIAFNEVGETFGCTMPQNSPSTQPKHSPSSSISRNSSDAGMLDNSLYSLYSGDDETYHVTVRPDEFSEKLNLKGEYNLVLGTQKLEVRDKISNAVLYVWPYKFLRRYGRDRSSFSMEGGRRCDPGPGRIIFDTQQGNEIFQKVQYYVKDMSSSTSNRGSNNNVHEESQPPLPARGYLDNHDSADLYVNENRDVAPVQRLRVHSLESNSMDKNHVGDWKKGPNPASSSMFLKKLDKTLQNVTPGVSRVSEVKGHQPVQRSSSVDPVYTTVSEPQNVWNPPKTEKKTGDVLIDTEYSELNINAAGPATDLQDHTHKKDLAKKKKELKKAESERKKKAESERKKAEEKKEKEKKEEEKARRKLEKRKPPPPKISKDRMPNATLSYEDPNSNKPSSLPIHNQPEECLYEDTNSMSQDPNVYDSFKRPGNLNRNLIQKPANEQMYDHLNHGASTKHMVSTVRHDVQDSTYGRLEPRGVDISKVGDSEYNILTYASEESEAIPVRMDDLGYISAEGSFRFKRDDDVGNDQVGLYATAE